MKVGDIVETTYGNVGTIVAMKQLFVGVWRYTVQLDDVQNHQGQVFHLGRVTLYEGQLRVLSSLELLAKSA